jgi:hypothetical protein
MSGQTKWLLALGVLGWLGSYLFFFLWFQVHGFDILGGWKEGFTASVFGTGFLLDLVACTFMVLVLGISERHKLGWKWTLAIVAGTIGLGVCIGLALYFVGKEIKGGTVEPSGSAL